MKGKTLVILMIVAGAAAVAAIVALSGERRAESGKEDAKLQALFPGLAGRVNDVASVTVQTPTGLATVEAKDGKWALKEKSGYPVDAAKVRELVLNLAAMKDLEPRTGRAEMYKGIGVEDVKPKAADTPPPDPTKPPADEPSRAMLVTLNGADGKPLASVIVGNTKYEAGGQAVYVRKPGEATSYLAKLGGRRFDVPREPINWVDSTFADVRRDRVRSVTVTPRDGGDAEKMVVSKEKPDAGSFAMQNIPAGKELKNPSVVETIASGLAQANFEDVATVGSIDFAGGGGGAAGGKPGPTVKVRTWDGLIVDVNTTEVNGKTWWKLQASADPDPYKEAPAAPAPAPAADGSTPPAPAPGEPKPKRTPEEVAKEVAELNAKWSPWAFSLPSYKASGFNTKLSDQLKDPAPATPPVAPGGPGPGPGMPGGLPPGMPGIPAPAPR